MNTYYHISRIFLGDNCIFEPKIPSTSHPFKEDNKTPRICLAPTIHQCLMGISGSDKYHERWDFYFKDKFDDLYIYIYIGEVTEPTKVPDVHRTNEKWLLVPSKLHFSHKLSYEEYLSFKPL